jgi:hypothetical protein
VGYGQTLWAIALAYGIRIDQIRAWNNIATDSNDIYAGQKLLVRPANLAVVSPTLSTEPGTRLKEGVTVSTLLNTVEGTTTQSPPANTPTVPDLAVLVPTEAETKDEIQALAEDSLAESELLAPFLAGGSFLIGCALLLILRINKKLS